MSKIRALPFDFLAGGGEMGTRIREHNWLATSLGAPETWPEALKTMVGVLLASNHPMFIWWDPDLVQFYNDAYSKTMGPERHPSALGQPGRECWAEIWEIIGPQIEFVLAGKGSTWHEEQLVPITRHGKLDNIWWTYGFSPIGDESGVRGVLVVCNEVTKEYLGREKLKEQIRLREQIEERQALQLMLADRLRELPEPDDIIAKAAGLLGQHLRATRVCYAEIDAGEEIIRVTNDWTDGAVPSIAGKTIALKEFNPKITEDLLQGRILRISDFSDIWVADDAPANSECHTRSMLVVPLIKAGRLNAIFAVGYSEIYVWADADAVFVEDVAERTWTAVDRARAEKALNAQQAAETNRLRALFDQAPGFMAVTRGPNHVFEFHNTAYLRLIGHREVLGKPIREAFPELEGHDFFELLDNVFSTGKSFTASEASLQIQHTSNEAPVERFINFIYQPVIEGDGSISGIFVEGYDVTDRKEALEELRAADARKDEFLAMLAHELRNPLAPISTAAQLLHLMQIEEPRVKKIADIINRQVVQLTKLLDDLLDVSRVTRGLIVLNKEPIDLKNIVAGAIEQVRPFIEERHHQLIIEISPEQAYVYGDSVRLMQVLTNLLNNAARYTPEHGKIKLTMDVIHAEVVVSVEDNGVGIDAQLAPHIFDLFSRGERSFHPAHGGLGLGLALVKRLVEVHGGTVTMQSAGPGKGSVFTIHLSRIDSVEDSLQIQENISLFHAADIASATFTNKTPSGTGGNFPANA